MSGFQFWRVIDTNNKRNPFALFLEFARFGCFTFGGGWSIIAQMQQYYGDRRKEITSQELMDLTSVAKSLPGTMIANVAMLYGYRAGGLAGGFAAVFGMILPPMVVIVIISYCYAAFRSNPWVSAAMSGMQAAVVPIILSAAIKLSKGAFPEKICYALCIGGCVLNLVFGVNCVVVILLGVAAGLLMSKWKEAAQ